MKDNTAYVHPLLLRHCLCIYIEQFKVYIAPYLCSTCLAFLIYTLGINKDSLIKPKQTNMEDAEQSQAKTCPQCRSNQQVIRIVYGRPGPGLQEEAEKGTVMLGGCTPKDEKSFCKNCQTKF